MILLDIFKKEEIINIVGNLLNVLKEVISDAQDAARKMVLDLGGSGIFGVEFFVTKSDQVIFSELSPRPHDTGMVTMYTQNYSQFDIHARALLGMPLPEIKLLQSGASHVILAKKTQLVII